MPCSRGVLVLYAVGRRHGTSQHWRLIRKMIYRNPRIANSPYPSFNNTASKTIIEDAVTSNALWRKTKLKGGGELPIILCVICSLVGRLVVGGGLWYHFTRHNTMLRDWRGCVEFLTRGHWPLPYLSHPKLRLATWDTYLMAQAPSACSSSPPVVGD